MSLISREELILGAPCKFKNICTIYQPILRDIIEIGFNRYHYFVNLLTMEPEDIAEIQQKKGSPISLEDIDIFDHLLLSCQYDNTFFLDFKEALTTFIKEEVIISFEGQIIIVGDPLERRVIDKNTFLDFSTVIRQFNRMRVKERPPENETPMQKKFRLKREKRDRVKEKQQQKDGKSSVEFADIISALCVMNVGINLLNIEQYTIYQIKEQLERAQAHEQYYSELNMLMAGADSKKIKPEYYLKKL